MPSLNESKRQQLQADYDLTLKQFEEVSTALRLNLNPSDIPKLEEQRKRLEAGLHRIEEALRALGQAVVPTSDTATPQNSNVSPQPQTVQRPAKKHRVSVMVSSTSRDLPKHRQAAIDAILRKGWFPLAMEQGAATPADAIKFSLDMVDEAEVYIGIFGLRYGYVPDDKARNPHSLSVTELEYRRAVERAIPVLIFLMADDHPGPATIAEADTFFEQNPDSKVKLKRLKEELGIKYVAGFFKSPDELSRQIYHALDKLEQDGYLDK